MAIVLGLLTAFLYGVGDFCGGLATKRLSVLKVVGYSHVLGFVGVVIAAILVDNIFVWKDVGLGALGGLFGMVGVGLLYRRLAVGPMSVVAPITAITSAAVPALWGVIGGERLTLLGWGGIAVAFAAVLLVSLEGGDSSNDGGTSRVSAQVIIESLLAGVGFGSFFVMLDAADSETAPWPVVGARVASSVAIGLAAVWIWLAAKQKPPVPGSELPNADISADDRFAHASPFTLAFLVVIVGLTDTAANVAFIYAVQIGTLTVVSVLSALYPLSTVALARVVLGEQIGKPRLAGLGLAVAASQLLALA